MNKQSKKKPSTGNSFNYYWIYAITIALLIGIYLFNNSSSMVKSISQNRFETFLTRDQIRKIKVEKKPERAIITLKPESVTPTLEKQANTPSSNVKNITGPHFEFYYGDLGKLQDKITQADPNSKIEVIYDNSEDVFMKYFMDIFVWLFILGFLWFFIFRRIGAGASGGPGGQIFNIGRSKAKLFDQNTHVKTTFKDVAGLEGAKEEIQEIVDFLKSPEKFTRLGGKIPKGVLLVGPPGTGKTLLAKAVAGEAKAPFFSLSGSDFVEMFVGVGASRVRDLFHQAKEKSPSIIFIDEVDAIGRARGKNNITGANDERENTLNQLLTEMDGFDTDTNVIIIAATNRADILDKALLRPGRFDRNIQVDLPELKEREAIFKVHLSKLTLSNDIDVDFLAKQTPGFSGADIANVCNEAALVAARKNKKAIEKQDFLDAVDRIIGGLEKKSKIIKPNEKERIAYHEAGHATVSWLLEHAAPLIKVTIVPRGQSLGAAWYLPEERQITTTEQILDEMCATLAGRAAEKVKFNNISTGALSDLERVTKQAQAMVSVYGLNENIGNVSYYNSNDGSEYNFSKPYSEKTAETIDKEISGIIEGQYQRALDILTENFDKLSELAKLLLEKEVIFKDDLETIFGKRAFEEKVEEEVSAPIVDKVKNHRREDDLIAKE